MENTRTIVVGLGGAGCRVVSRLSAGGYDPGLALAAVDCDAKSIADSSAMTKLQIGTERTAGMSCGGDPDVGREAAEEDIEMMRGLFTDAQLVIVCAGLGGGAASGALPVLLEVIRESSAFALCLVSLPFEFEGAHKKIIAEQALAEIKERADIVAVIPNDRLMEATGQKAMGASFEKADEVLAGSVGAIYGLLLHPGILKVDLATFRNVAEHGGRTCTFVFAEAQGSDRPAQLIEELKHSPLSEDGRLLSEADALLVSIAGGEDFTLKEMTDVMNRLSSMHKPDCKLFLGTVIKEDMQGKLSVTVLVPEKWQDSPDQAQVSALKTASSPAKKKKHLQTELELTPDKGRFVDVDPTILDGQNLDTPTFIRRRITIEK